ADWRGRAGHRVEDAQVGGRRAARRGNTGGVQRRPVEGQAGEVLRGAVGNGASDGRPRGQVELLPHKLVAAVLQPGPAAEVVVGDLRDVAARQAADGRDGGGGRVDGEELPGGAATVEDGPGVVVVAHLHRRRIRSGPQIDVLQAERGRPGA